MHDRTFAKKQAKIIDLNQKHVLYLEEIFLKIYTN